jgi:hypothetical protein
MLFSIDEDSGGRLEGWVMPDNPAAAPRIVVRLDAEHHVALEAFVYRPLLKENGLHNTGICGFVLDEGNCPGLTSAGQLEIHDADNNLLIYRRKPRAGLIEKKFFRLEPQLLRSVALDELFEPHFHMTYPALEFASEETIRSILSIPFTPSIYAAGRVFWRVWEPLLRDRGYRVGVVLRDPCHEMAERLLILKMAASPQSTAIADALGPAVEAAAAHLRDVNLKDVASLEAALATAPVELRTVLYNPLTCLLSAQNAFDPPPVPATAVALESLADMDAVGLRQDTESFLGMMSAILELPHTLAPISLPTSATVLQWADVLRDRPAVRSLIEMDIEVYQTVTSILTGQSSRQAIRST